MLAGRVQCSTGVHGSDTLNRIASALVGVLPPQTMLLDVAGPCEVLRAANRQQSNIHFEVRYVGASDSIATSVGLRLHGVEPLPESIAGDAIVVIVGSVKEPMLTVNQPARQEQASGEAEIVLWLKTAIRPGHKLISICSGALLAGRAGLASPVEGHAARVRGPESGRPVPAAQGSVAQRRQDGRAVRTRPAW